MLASRPMLSCTSAPPWNCHSTTLARDRLLNVDTEAAPPSASSRIATARCPPSAAYESALMPTESVASGAPPARSSRSATAA